MVWLVLVVAAVVLGYLSYVHYEVEMDSPPPPVDPEQELKAALELHAIRRRLDNAELRHERRRDMAKLKAELDDELGNERP